jgi:hypothetical protein
MTIFNASVVNIDKNVEEEVTLDIGNVEITCFACFSPYKFSVGYKYSISLELMCFNDFEVREMKEAKREIVRIKNTFSYFIRGELNGNVLDAGLRFEDNAFLDFPFYNGKYIELKVDRIDAEFL